MAVSGKTSSTPTVSTAAAAAAATTTSKPSTAMGRTEIRGGSSNGTSAKPSSPSSVRKGYGPAAKQKYDLPGGELARRGEVDRSRRAEDSAGVEWDVV